LWCLLGGRDVLKKSIRCLAMGLARERAEQSRAEQSTAQHSTACSIAAHWLPLLQPHALWHSAAMHLHPNVPYRHHWPSRACGDRVTRVSGAGRAVGQASLGLPWCSSSADAPVPCPALHCPCPAVLCPAVKSPPVTSPAVPCCAALQRVDGGDGHKPGGQLQRRPRCVPAHEGGGAGQDCVHLQHRRNQGSRHPGGQQAGGTAGRREDG